MLLEIYLLIRYLYFILCMNASLDIYFSSRKCRIVNTMVGISALHMINCRVRCEIYHLANIYAT